MYKLIEIGEFDTYWNEVKSRLKPSDELRDLLNRMFEYNPVKRITTADIKEHRWYTNEDVPTNEEVKKHFEQIIERIPRVYTYPDNLSIRNEEEEESEDENSSSRKYKSMSGPNIERGDDFKIPVYRGRNMKYAQIFTNERNFLKLIPETLGEDFKLEIKNPFKIKATSDLIVFKIELFSALLDNKDRTAIYLADFTLLQGTMPYFFEVFNKVKAAIDEQYLIKA